MRFAIVFFCRQVVRRTIPLSVTTKTAIIVHLKSNDSTENQTKPDKPVRKVENRSKLSADRRVADRRKVPRFEPNRRSGKERRPEIWDPSIKNST